MIYLVTTQKSLWDCSQYEIISPTAAISMLEKEDTLGADTETEGFSPYTKRLLTIQLGTEDFQVVWDCTSYSIQMLKGILENPQIKTIWWNYKFDAQFLYHQRIIPVNIYDGMLAEKLMWLGYPSGMHSMSLKAAGKYYCNIELDKTVRGKIINVGITAETVVYAANDVKYEIPIYEAQQKLLKDKDLLKAVEFENEFVKCLAYIEYCGVKLDVQKWKVKMQKDKDNYNTYLNALNKWVVDYFQNNHIELANKFITVNLQGDLFSGFDSEPKCTINWDSSKQVIPLFELLGFKLETFDKLTKTKKKSIDAKIIEPQKNISDIADIYLKYKAAQKVVTTYGDNFIKAINPVSGRIHASFNQLMDTGRLSCGGGEAAINVQNLPHDAETRACFVADSGNKWISADYQSQESRLIASISNDAAMIDLFENGCGDVHSLVAKMAYSHVIGDCPVEEVKSKFKNYRQEAKGIEFAINYGGDANTIANNKGVPIKEAQAIYDNFMKGFPGVKRYQDFCRKDVMQKGYILLNPITRHKAYIFDFEELKSIEKRFQDEGFWEYYNEMKGTYPECDTVKDVKHYFKRKSASEKQSINYRIQGAGAMCFKLFSIKLFNWLKKNNLLFTVKYCIPVHDEANLEAPEEISEQVAEILVKCMESASAPFCTRVHLGADVEIGEHWVH